MFYKQRFILIGFACLILGIAVYAFIQYTNQPRFEFDRPLSIGIIDYPPYSYVLDGEPTGTGVEIVKEAFKRLEIDTHIDLYIWDDLMEQVRLGQVDVIVDVYKTEERDQFLIFSDSHYGVYPLYFFGNAEDSIRYNGDLKSMSDYTIGTIKGFYYGSAYEAAYQSGDLHILESDSARANMMQLIDGHVDLVIETLYSGQTLVNQLKMNDRIVIVEPEIDFLYSYIGFSKANDLADIRDAYDQTIAAMKEDGTYHEIYLKYSPGELK